jgi:hypothetical protein
MPHKRKLAKVRSGLADGFYWVQIMEGAWEPASYVDGTFFVPGYNVGFDRVLVCGARLFPPGQRIVVVDSHKDRPSPRRPITMRPRTTPRKPDSTKGT